MLALMISAAAANAREQAMDNASPPTRDSGFLTPDTHVQHAFAQVLNVEPVYDEVVVTHEVERCGADDQDDDRIPEGGSFAAGVLSGGISMMAAAAATRDPGVRRPSSRNRPSERERVPECVPEQTVETEYRLVGYDVEYRYRGEVFMSRLPDNPGDRLRIRVAVSPAIDDSDHHDQLVVD